MRRQPKPETTCKYSYLYAFMPDAIETDNVYSLYGVARNYFEIPDPTHISGDFWLITWFGAILHYVNGLLVEQQPFPAKKDSRFVWYTTCQVPDPQF